MYASYVMANDTRTVPRVSKFIKDIVSLIHLYLISLFLIFCYFTIQKLLKQLIKKYLINQKKEKRLFVRAIEILPIPQKVIIYRYNTLF